MITNIKVGELLPWKGVWYKVMAVTDKNQILLSEHKPTAKAEKLIDRKIRWAKQHPKAV